MTRGFAQDYASGGSRLDARGRGDARAAREQKASHAERAPRATAARSPPWQGPQRAQGRSCAFECRKFEGRRDSYMCRYTVDVGTFKLSALKGARSAQLSVGPAMAAISPPLHAVRAQHGLPSARAPRARPLSLAHPALIPPKHSPVRPRLSCLLTLNCSRVPCSELTSSRSTARLFELIRRRPGSKGGVCSPNSNTRPPGPFHRMIYTLVAAAARGFLTIGPC